MFTSNIQFGYPCLTGGGQAVQAGLSCHPAQDLGQTVSSVNSYCTIILEYLVVRDVNITSAKLDCGLSILSEILGAGGGGGQINRPGHLAPHPFSIRNPSEHLK